jgi:hypothetical protein
MFEHRPLKQKLLIRKIRAFLPAEVEAAQRSLGQIVGHSNMPYTDQGLKALLGKLEETKSKNGR